MNIYVDDRKLPIKCERVVVMDDTPRTMAVYKQNDDGTLTFTHYVPTDIRIG